MQFYRISIEPEKDQYLIDEYSYLKEDETRTAPDLWRLRVDLPLVKARYLIDLLNDEATPSDWAEIQPEYASDQDKIFTDIIIHAFISINGNRAEINILLRNKPSIEETYSILNIVQQLLMR